MHALNAIFGLTVGLLLALSGLYLGLRDASDAFHHTQQLLHTGLGWLILVPAALAVWRHKQVRGSNPTGWTVMALLLAVAVTGALHTVLALRDLDSPTWLMPAHGWTSLALAVLLLTHLAKPLMRHHTRWLRRWALPTGAAAVVGAGLSSAAGLWVQRMIPDPSPKGYSTPWNNKLFAPANGVLLDHEGFLHPSQLAGSAACGQCHPDIYAQWSVSMHRHAADDPHVEIGTRWFQRENGAEAGRFCAACHNPIVLFSGQFDPATTPWDTGSPTHDEGISCLSCHAIAAVGQDPLGNGSYHLQVPSAPLFGGLLDRLLIRLDVPSHQAAMMKRPLFQESRYCASCHQQYIPEVLDGPGPVVFGHQFHEWKDSKYAVKGSKDFKRCNDCHMPLVDSTDPAATDGKIHSHRFAAANHAFYVQAQYPEQARLALAQLKRAVTLHIAPAAIQDTPDHLTVEVTVTNVGAGHSFPSGTTDISQAWLEVVAGSDPKAPLWVSGRLDARHYLDPKAHQWRKVFVDKANVPVDLHNLAIVDRTTVDDYIAPGEQDVAVYQIPIGKQRDGTIPVRVRLRLRKANQRWEDWLTNFDGTTLPVTDVRSAEITVDLKDLHIPSPTLASAPAKAAPITAPPILGMAFVPAGPAMIGQEDGDADERPARIRQIDSFYIDNYPVTNARYRRFLVATGRPGPVFKLGWANKYNWSGQDFPPGTEDRPVVLINHEEAAAYCAWRQKRLPREVEWEKAARGSEGRRYPWGDRWADGACAALDGVEVPPRVGMCPNRRSPYGVEDMIGGVFEWVGDWYRAYDRTFLHPNDNEWITTFGDPNYVLRGSPSGQTGPSTTAASRTGHADNMRAKIGFRCAKSLEVGP